MSFLKSTLLRARKNEQSASYIPNNDSIHSSLTKNIAVLDTVFSETPDLIVRFIEIKQTGGQGALIFLEGLVDKNSINNDVLRPLLYETGDVGSDITVSVGHVKAVNTWSQIESAIFQGYSILLIDNRAEALLFKTQGWPQRAIEDPNLETSLKGAHLGFVETGSQSIALIRLHIPDSDLKIKELIVGRRGKTKVSIVYLEDIALPEVLQELEDRISKLDVDAIISSGELAELIQDNPFSPFPQFLSTARPDFAASQILQGRMVMVVDRSPSVLIGPATFTMFFQNIDDYSTQWIVASFIRLQRYLGFLIAVFLPAFYIALISFNYELIPMKLLLSIGESRGRVPFPPLIEAIIMELAIEMMREAGIRLPAPIGQTVGIVGGIVIGQAAVQAGIVSNIMVIIVALTAIASFILPNYDMASGFRLIRFPMMLIASQLGIFGIVIGLLILIAHLISLESLGTPFGSPFAPMKYSGLKDTIIRFPLYKMTRQPKSTHAIQSMEMENRRPEDDGQ
ncbi:spore germination protein [Paenibacillus sp. SYP-B3998]|uniref:Spore germination protein n=1 Tax=Paenibacillus sp. SYP-B3998 TaxID=2678564 RepID=A0A6G4A3M0_9BACL|nr:spore germination protein [Paenibacillus sp. SYP-B3998]NEW09063.1 spore germination protein [Paenibacillus sp. SYP-B3998]